MNNRILSLMKWAETELGNSDVECARKEAEILFMDSFNVRHEDIYLMEDFKPSASDLNLFKNYVGKRRLRYPLQYLLKNTEFMSLSFKLEEGVFIPRRETELLVEKVLEEIKQSDRKRINIFDIGTGCGNIAISLTKNVTDCKIIASDISDKALRVAAENARFHGVDKKIEFIESDLFDNIAGYYHNYFDIIISNPPYIHKRDIEHLQPEISYEDVKALDGGKDGLYFFQRILSEGTRYLKKGGIFAFEIGRDQAEGLEDLIEANDAFFSQALFKDYSGYNRVIIART